MIERYSRYTEAAIKAPRPPWAVAFAQKHTIKIELFGSLTFPAHYKSSTQITSLALLTPYTSITSPFIQSSTKTAGGGKHCTVLLLCLEPISNNCTRSSLIPQPVLTLFIRHELRSEHCSPNPSGLCPHVPVAQLSWLSPPHKILWEKSDSSLWKAWKTELEYIHCVSVSPVANATLIHKKAQSVENRQKELQVRNSYTMENTP